TASSVPSPVDDISWTRLMRPELSHQRRTCTRIVALRVFGLARSAASICACTMLAYHPQRPPPSPPAPPSKPRPPGLPPRLNTSPGPSPFASRLRRLGGCSSGFCSIGFCSIISSLTGTCSTIFGSGGGGGGTGGGGGGGRM